MFASLYINIFFLFIYIYVEFHFHVYGPWLCIQFSIGINISSHCTYINYIVTFICSAALSPCSKLSGYHESLFFILKFQVCGEFLFFFLKRNAWQIKEIVFTYLYIQTKQLLYYIICCIRWNICWPNIIQIVTLATFYHKLDIIKC